MQRDRRKRDRDRGPLWQISSWLPLLICLLSINVCFSYDRLPRGSLRRARAHPEFTFTAPLYNVTLQENARGTQFAQCGDRIRMGVPLPEPNANVKFKIVEGDKQHHFKAHAKVVGDFVFLRIRQKDRIDQPLNRELKDSYSFVVKATCKREDAGNLETTTRVRLMITDQNDASPMFTLEEEFYQTTIDDQLPVFSNVLQVEASDADIGFNGQIYYSLVNRSHLFTVDPVSGWIRTIRPLHHGHFDLQVKAEDRSSRLFYYDENERQPTWTADVKITVKETKRHPPKIAVEKRPIERGEKKKQLAAVFTVNSGKQKSSSHLSIVNSFGYELKKDGDVWNLYVLPGTDLDGSPNVTVMAGSEIPGERNTTATIRLDTQTTHKLKFDVEKFSFSVDECAPIAGVVGSVNAVTSLEEDMKLIRYFMESLDPNMTVPFQMSEDKGAIRISKQLDYENTKEHKFNVRAKLPSGEEASIPISVSVKDCNDHSPVWAAKWSRQGPISVLPETPVGQTIIKVDALDRDAGENGKVGYKIASDHYSPFQIDFETGEISLSTSLPKNASSWSVSVWAVDLGSPLPRALPLHLVFYRNGTKTPPKPRPVIGTHPPNSKPPVFKDFPKSIKVYEDAEVGEVIYTVQALDDDLGYNGMVRYSTWDDYFHVDAEMGRVSVAAPLTELFEKAATEKVERAVTIFAYDQGIPRKDSKKTLNIHILDVNNHPPKFDKPSYTVRVSEDVKVGEDLLIVQAWDRDAGENGRVGYRIASHPDADPPVEIDEKSGKIKVRETMDREENQIISLTVVAFDHGSPSLLAFANLTIELEDVNDNAPRCAQQVTQLRIPEDYPSNGLIGCVSAWDSDDGPNGRISYSIENEKDVPFRIDQQSGCIFVESEQPLDFEIRAIYNLSIEVSDNAEHTLSSMCSVIVQLEDVNENLHAPQFDDVAHEGSVYENSPPGTEVMTMLATDADDPNAPIRYSIVGGDGVGYFTIDSTGLIRTSSVLDREDRSAYWLVIEAEDSGTVPKRSTVHLYVRVLDRNDHRPAALQPVYFANVPENSPENSVVVKVEATDGDDLPFESPQPLTFKIQQGDPQSFFRIDQNTGYIVTSGSRRLDRETQKEHELTVRVCDSGETQLCTDIPVIVQVDDVNDNAPVFAQPIHHYNVPAGVTGLLCRVFAVDADAGRNAELYYNITDGHSRFTIDQDGHIETKEMLGHDEVFALTIQATDRGNPAQTAQTRVLLTAVARPNRKGKNGKPQFIGKEKDMNLPISDNDQVGVTIGVLEAKDDDGDSLWWSIVDGNINNTFAVKTDSGALLLAKPIDQLDSNIKEVLLKLRVSDGKDHDEIPVTLSISRSAVDRPVFSALHYKTQIGEKTPIGTQIYSMKASTRGPSIKPIVYAIYNVESTAADDKLRIEPSSGHVVVMEQLDFERARTLRLTVSARQGMKNNYATLEVTLTDDNDNSPRFTQQNYEATVSVSAPVGMVVSSVLATDIDNGENGVVKYEIVSGNEMNFFKIDRATGEITVAKVLSQDYQESILGIRASDNGDYPLSDLASIRIVLAANETQPLMFTKPTFQRSVKENTPVGSIILVVGLEDSQHALFSLLKPCPYFDIHPISGAVSLRKWLTSERSPLVSCTVEAKARDSRKTRAKVSVKIIDSNEHAPIFKQQIYTAYVRENSPAGSPVLLSDNSPLIVSAFDLDSGSNAQIGYRILSPNEPYFIVDYVSGAVRTRKPLDFERVKEWSFYVQASDMGARPRTSPVPALVNVIVQDANDVKPEFTSSEYKASLLLPTVKGVKVLDVLAKDADTVGRLRYSIREKQMTSLFSVDPETGRITVSAESSAAYVKESYKFELLVSDGVQTASTTVVIAVEKASEKGFRFPRAEYSSHVKENHTYTVGHKLLTVTAFGARDGIPVTYSILNDREEFGIQSGTGVLYLTGRTLDREKEETISVVVQGTTHEREAKHCQTVVTIHVDDVNDNAPAFLNLPFNAVISKEAKQGERAILIKAVDADHGANGLVHYTSEDIPPYLILNKLDGKILVGSSLKDLPPQVVHFTVKASDQGTPPLSSTARVRIQIVDKSQPIFSQQIYRVELEGDVAKSTRVVQVKGRSLAGGQLAFSIRDGDSEGNFEIDPDTGVITVSSPFDSESSNKYNLTVVARDVIRKNTESVATVFVVTKRVAALGPAFSVSQYRVRIRESTPVGQEILRVEANGQTDISYAVEGENSQLVSCDPSTGVISLASPLDFETLARLSLTVRAVDVLALSAEVPLIIEVDDVNDVAPRFLSPISTVSVSDTAVVGDFVAIMSVEDQDTVSSLPDRARLLYSVIEGDETLFRLDRQSGEIRIDRNIEEDDLSERQKIVNVSVSDGVHTSYGQLTVSLTVSPARLPPPRFAQSQYVVGIRENNSLSNRSALLIVQAKEGVPPLRYSLGGGRDAKTWPLRIEHATGKIHPRIVLDYATREKYIIPLVVEDALGRRAFSTLTLNVIDENNSSPEFTATKYQTTVSASSKEGDSVLLVSAVDVDQNDGIEYSLFGDDRATSAFKIHPKQGIVSVKGGKLDQMVGKKVEFTVRATDEANPPHHANTEVQIEVLASDVAVPRFSNHHYVFVVQEDAEIGTIIGKLQQINTDIGEVRFSIDEGNSADLPINVERASGRLIVRQKLDREKKQQWRFTVRADAARGASTLALVTVNVGDVNDNAPMFHGSYEKVSIGEDAPVGTSIAVFSSTDRDRGQNARITFSLLESKSSDDVKMDSDSGWLLVAKPLDRETKSNYDLTARATDEGGLSTDLNFTLSILDANDSPPVFDQKIYTTTIDPIDLTVGLIVMKVKVTDADLPPFNNTRLLISEGNELGLFSIDSQGRVSVRRTEIPEKRENIEMTLLAHDGTHTSTAKLVVKIKQVPRELDCPTTPIEISVAEDSKKGTKVYSKGLNGVRVIYQLIDKKGVGTPFSVDKHSGAISLNGKLDRETTNKYSFIRSATMGSSKCVQHVRVTVTDVNDNSPVFESANYSVTIKENQPATEDKRMFVAWVKAHDADSAAAGRIVYSLQDPHSPFEIDEDSGAVTVTKPLDRETTAEYALTVVAKDQDPEKPRQSTSILKVTVADQNDNPPEFERKEYNLQVMESESVGYVLATLSANGGDEGETVTYELAGKGGNYEKVTLDGKTGVLKLSAPLDFEVSRQLTVKVKATDSGKEPLSTETIVNIQVLDENDNAPQFAENTYKATLKENSPNGTAVKKMIATDADSEHYGRVAYSLRGESEKFSISDDGTVTLIGSVDHEDVSNYRLIVRAQDGGSPPKHADVTLLVEIEDENDNYPKFAECNMTAVVQESAEPGHLVMSLSMSDLDSPRFAGPFKISIKGSGSETFAVDENLHIVTAGRLDHARVQNYLLTIVATDNGGLSSSCPLTIYVQEDSRHAPSLDPLRIQLNTLMGESRAGIVGVLTATDKDPKDMIRYALVEGSVVPPRGQKPHMFRVESETGHVWSDHSIVPGIHSFNVSVTDGKFTTASYVEITVLDVDSDLIDHAVSVRLRSMTVQEFFEKHAQTFAKVFATHLNVQIENVRLLSVQDVEKGRAWRRRRSESETDVDVLFAVIRGGKRGMLKPDLIYTRLKQEIVAIKQQSDNVKYQLVTELCTPGVCQRGECRERVQMSDVDSVRIFIDNSAYVAPRHSRTHQCFCPEGYGGSRCERELNRCARSPCNDGKMCIPSNNSIGFECLCPPGTTGKGCAEQDCEDEGTCQYEAELSVQGDGFFSISLGHSIEQRMELSFRIRTLSQDGIVLHSRGIHDFHLIELISGRVEYRWECGSGEGVVRSRSKVSDGKWHTIRISRKGRRVQMTVADSEVIEGWSPAGSDVINLHSYSQKLVFGGRVHRTPNTTKVTQGVAACFSRIQIDGRPLALTQQGLRLWSAYPGCRALQHNRCISMPCKNGAVCLPIGNNDYKCQCGSRYSGAHCEIDMDPCGSKPCPLGIQCIPFYNDYLCKCPNGFTGKRCEMRGYEEEDVCAANPCGTHGSCIPIPRQHVHNAGFICNCTHGFSGKACDEISAGNIWARVSLWEILICVAVLSLLIVIVCLIVVICKWMRKSGSNKKYGSHVHVPHMANPLLPPPPTVDSAPPPLPPRAFRNNNQLSNLEQAQLTGLPTVQVRPLPAHERVSSSRGDSRSPSLGNWKQGGHRESRPLLDSARDYGSAADELELMGRSADRQTLDALRRFGVRLSEDDVSRDRGDLSQDRHPLGDSIQCLSTHNEEMSSLGWSDVDRIGDAVRAERLRLENLTGRVLAGQTELSPINNDADYMTMRPKRVTGSAESQRRPLLAEEETGEDNPLSSSRPTVPLHKVAPMEESRLYDDIAESKQNTISQIDDIDNSDVDEMPEML